MCFCVLNLIFVSFFFFFNDTATTEIYTLSLHDALPICRGVRHRPRLLLAAVRRAAASRSRSEEHTSELQSRETISYAVFCLKKKKTVADDTASDSVWTRVRVRPRATQPSALLSRAIGPHTPVQWML